jgi:hypothetical protein
LPSRERWCRVFPPELSAPGTSRQYERSAARWEAVDVIDLEHERVRDARAHTGDPHQAREEARPQLLLAPLHLRGEQRVLLLEQLDLELDERRTNTSLF